MNNNAKKVMDFSNDNEEQDKTSNEKITSSNKQTNNYNNGNGVRKNNFFNTKKSATKNEENVSTEKTDNLDKNEFKRDDSKWKFSKNELLERKKKLLKDKSNIKLKNSKVFIL